VTAAAAAALAVAAIVLAASWLATRLVLLWLRRKAILDAPNARSSHSAPTPRGGGIAVLAAALPAWMAVAMTVGPAAPILAAVAAAAVLAAISWIDDRRGLVPALRLAAQALAIAIGLAALPADGAVFLGWLPPALDRLVAGLAWLWFVNLFNFMDGIDGLAAGEAAAVASGIALLAALAPQALPAATQLLAVALAAAALGFLRWNWAPAKLFLGDVGSVPLGYLLGWLLLLLAQAGSWAAALILPLYFLADASWTLLRRLLRGERIWEAHRQHFYQRAVQRGRSHAAVTLRVLALDLVLIALAAWSCRGAALPALAAAAAATAAVLANLSRSERPSAS
jgi:UDP-N-acetylmuramyl pentapeptide phosphotransferase/UDP-N-acetylglucosamine-1-phosphate transferase